MRKELRRGSNGLSGRPKCWSLCTSAARRSAGASSCSAGRCYGRAGTPRAFWVCMLSCAVGATLQIPFVYQQLVLFLGDDRYASVLLLSAGVAAAVGVRTVLVTFSGRPASAARWDWFAGAVACAVSSCALIGGHPEHELRVRRHLWLRGRDLAKLAALVTRAWGVRLDDAQRVCVLPPLPSGLRPPGAAQGVMAGRCGERPLPQLGWRARGGARRLAPRRRTDDMEVVGQLGRGIDLDRKHVSRHRRGSLGTIDAICRHRCSRRPLSLAAPWLVESARRGSPRCEAGQELADDATSGAPGPSRRRDPRLPTRDRARREPAKP